VSDFGKKSHNATIEATKMEVHRVGVVLLGAMKEIQTPSNVMGAAVLSVASYTLLKLAGLKELSNYQRAKLGAMAEQLVQMSSDFMMLFVNDEHPSTDSH